MSFLAELRDAHILVFGAGVTGKPTIDFLNFHGANCFAIDEKLTGEGIHKDISQIDLSKIKFGVVSPGWHPDNQLIRQCKDAGIELISEIDLAWRVKKEIAPDQRWLAVTGTNGKTSTVQITAAILNAGGFNTVACGNLGFTAIEAVAGAKAEILVLELSSFQLEWSHEACFVSVAVLNIAEDHIDWHGSFSNYAAAKFRIADRAENVILNAHDAEIVARAKNLTQRIVWFSLDTPAPHQLGLVENLLIDRAFISKDAEVLCELQDITPAGPHNVLNTLAAAALARSVGVTAESVTAAMKSFRLDHHRLEVVLEKNGITWIDDSKATNPHAAIAALQSQLKSIWIAGGLAKGASMDELIQRCATRIKLAILIGTDAPKIAEALTKFAPDIPQRHITGISSPAEIMKEVVKIAAQSAQPGDVVLLAPACASMDLFKNYAERGDLFAAAVKEQVGV